MRTAKAERLAKEKLKEHGLAASGWRFVWDAARVRFGCCNYRKKVIQLSKPLVRLNDEERVMDTILHEVAHALTPGQHHNRRWQLVAQEIGCNGRRCYDDTVAQPKAPFMAICGNCGQEHPRFRRPRRSVACGTCCKGVYNEAYKLTFNRV